MDSIIRADKVCKKFGSGETVQSVLNDVSFEINRGEYVSLCGESGCGKSTLLYLVGGLDRAFDGSITVCGSDIAKMSDRELSTLRGTKLGFVFQFYNLVANLTVEENILMPLEMSGRRISDYRKKLDELLELTGLTEKRKSYPHMLSGGQQQRCAVLRAVIGAPELILADEPTGNLDAKSGAEIMDLFRLLNKEKGITILMVTHSAECAAYSDRTLYIRNGVIDRES